MTPSHDAPDTGPTSFDDGPAPATLGLSRREMRAAERARALALGIDEADDAPADEPAAAADDPTAGPSDERPATPTTADAEASSTSRGDGSGSRPGEATTPPAVPLSAPGIGPDTSAILLSGGVLTRRQLRAIREAEEAAREQRGSEHDEAQSTPAGSETGSTPSDVEPTAAAVDDAPPSSSETSVPPYARYGRGSRATPRPRAPYGSAYRRGTAAEATGAPAADAPAADVEAQEKASVATVPADREATPAETSSAWPFAPIVPSGDAAGRDVDASGEQPTVPPLAAHSRRSDEDPRPTPSLDATPWVMGSAEPALEPAFGTRASAAEDLPDDRTETPDADSASTVPAPTDSAAPDARAPYTPPTGHWSVQDQVDEDQPHTGNHFILPTVPHANDMQQALNARARSSSPAPSTCRAASAPWARTRTASTRPTWTASSSRATTTTTRRAAPTRSPSAPAAPSAHTPRRAPWCSRRLASASPRLSSRPSPRAGSPSSAPASSSSRS